MKRKILGIILILVLFSVALSIAATAVTIDDVLEITRVSADPNDVKPGETITVEVRVKNRGDTDIEDIELEIWLEDDDGRILEDNDGDDIEDDEEFDLNDGKTEELEFTFKMPTEDIDDGDEYFIYVYVEGIDEENSSIKYADIDNSEKIEFEKEKHEIIFSELVLSPSVITCDRDILIELELHNIGKKDEDDVVLTIKNSDLDIDIKEDFELDEDDDYDNIYPYTIKDDLEAGKYQIMVNVKYSDERETEILELTVKDCLKGILVAEPDTPEVTIKTIPMLTGAVFAKPVEKPKTALPEVSSTTLLIAVIVLLVIVAFMLEAAISGMKKKPRRRPGIMKNF